jgi:hypothetical protein
MYNRSNGCHDTPPTTTHWIRGAIMGISETALTPMNTTKTANLCEKNPLDLPINRSDKLLLGGKLR